MYKKKRKENAVTTFFVVVVFELQYCHYQCEILDGLVYTVCLIFMFTLASLVSYSVAAPVNFKLCRTFP